MPGGERNEIEQTMGTEGDADVGVGHRATGSGAILILSQNGYRLLDTTVFLFRAFLTAAFFVK